MYNVSRILSALLLSIVISQYSHGQEDSSNARYWINNELFSAYDTIERSIEAHLYLSDSEFIFEQYDHNKVKLIMGTYIINCSGILDVKYDIPKTIEFVEKNKDKDNSIILLANTKCYRLQNWRREESYIHYDYQLRDNDPRTKEYWLSLCID
jgi:hypothetical protein